MEIRQVALESYPMETLDQEKILYHQDDKATCFYIIQKGLVELSRLSKDGSKIILDLCGENEPLGLEEAMAGRQYLGTARALTPTTVYRLPLSVLRENYRENRNWFSDYLRWSYSRYEDLSDRCQSIMDQNLADRLFCQLCKLAYKYGEKVEDGVLIDIKLYRQTLANMVGCRVESVIRQFSQWEQEDLIRTEKARIVILEPAPLLQEIGNKCQGCYSRRLKLISNEDWDISEYLKTSA